MRKVRIATLIACIVLLIACGDDSSSAGDVYTYNINASLVVNEADHLLVMIPDSYPVDRCVSEGEALVWKTVIHQDKPDSLRYQFHGDSLFLSDVGSDGDASIFLGGHSGSVYGTWKYTFCRYNGQGGDIQCSEEDKRYFKYEIRFSEGRVNVKYDAYGKKFFKEQKSDDYMNTYFMYLLYNKLSNKISAKCESYMMFIDEIRSTNADSVQSAIQNCGVQVIEKTKNGGTFAIGGKTYTLTVNKDDLIFHMDEHDPYEETNINVDVSDGITICNAHFFRSNLVEGLCRAEYAEYMDSTTGLDGSGNEYSYARRILIENDREFDKCIGEIIVKGPEGSVEPLYKKSTKSGMGIEKFIDRNILKLLKYAKN